MSEKKQTARIIELQDDLSKMAAWLHHNEMPDMEPDDLAQEMNLAILEKAQQDPDFLLAKKSYIINFAIWRAKDAARKNRRRYTNHLAETDPDDDDPASFIAPDLDLDYSITIRQILDTLGEKTRSIALLLAQGYKKTEIAGMMKVTPQAIGYHVRQAQATFAEALA